MRDKYFLGLLVIVLVLGLIGCDNGTGGSSGNGGNTGNSTANPFKGRWTWTNSAGSITNVYVFADTTWTFYPHPGSLLYSDNTPVMSFSGTYSYNGNDATLSGGWNASVL